MLLFCSCKKENNSAFVYENFDALLQATIASQTVSIYPNPANNTVSIVGGQGAKVSISSITGQQVWSSLLTSSTFDIRYLPNGLYIVDVQLPNGSISTHRLAVQH